MRTELTISGRIIWSLSPNSNPMERITSKSKEGQIIYDKVGQPQTKTVFSLAIPKNSPQIAMLQQAQTAEMYKLYPSGQVPKTFAYKMIDGDVDIDDKGKPYSLREGHAGHMVVSFSSIWPVKWYQYDGANFNEINAGVKVGDYVDVNFTITAHGPSPKGGVAGFYMEPKAVLFTGVGDPIVKKAVTTFDPSRAFGGQQPQAVQQAAPQQFAPQAAFAQPQPQAVQPAQVQPMTQPQGFAQQPMTQPQPHYAGLPPQFRK